MNNIVITIGREYGSGGKTIGKIVADKLNIPFYDTKLIEEAYKMSGGDYSKFKQYDESKRNAFMKNLDIISNYNPELAFEDDKYQMLISNTISSISDNTSCVIIGRNANNVLKDRKNTINLFIYSNNLDFKIKRKMEIEGISYEEARQKMKKVDKKRKQFYEYLNKGRTWGDKREYDFLIDSSILGIEKTADYIVTLYNNLLSKN